MSPRARNAWQAFRTDDRGASLLEYSLLIGLITATLVLLIMVTVPGQIETMWRSLVNVLR